MTISSQRPFRARAVLAALGLLAAVLGLGQPVWARHHPPYIHAISPQGGAVLAAASPITVTWTTAVAGPVSVRVRNGNQEVWIASVAPNAGQYTFTLPDSFACDPLANYRIRLVQAVPGGTNYASDSGAFKLTCPVTVAVTKQVVNTTGRPSSGTFRMRVQCEPGSQTFADIAGSGQGSFTRKVHVPPGSTVCTVQETGMPVPPMGCTWLTTYPGGQQRAPGGPAVVVVNTLQCGPISPPTPR